MRLSRSPARAALAVAVLAIVAHLGILGAGYVYDDIPIIVENPALESLSNAGAWFTSGYWPGHDLYYRPLLVAGFALERAVFGVSAAAAHLVSVSWHALVSVLVLLLTSDTVRRVRPDRSATDPDAAAVAGIAAGALFAVHPLLTEPVYWISARSDLLGAASVLGALLLARHRPRGRGALLVGLVTLGGLLAKELVLVLPVALALDAAWVARAERRALAPRTVLTPATLAALLALAAYVALRAAAFDGRPFAGGDASDPLYNPLVGTGAGTRLLTALAILGTVLRLALWPHPLSSDYAYDSLPLATDASDPRVWLGAAVVIALAVALVRSVRARGPGAASVGLVLAVLTWLPASNTLVLGGALFGERFVYLPATGLALAFGALVGRAWLASGRQTRLALSVAGGIVLLAAGAADVARARDWRSNEALYASVVEARPRNAQGHYNLGTLALDEARARAVDDPRRRRLLEEAERRFARAASIYPAYVLARMNVGVARAERDEWRGALDAFQHAAEIGESDPRVQYNLGMAYERLGDVPRAIAHYRRSAALVPGGGPAANDLRRLAGSH